jgi:hypothetical protein
VDIRDTGMFGNSSFPEKQPQSSFTTTTGEKEIGLNCQEN